jgi:hypothetical protein
MIYADDGKAPDKSQFNEIVSTTVMERMQAVLGRAISESYSRYLQTHGIAVDEISDHPDFLFRSLRSLFGVGGDTIGKLIVRDLYRRCDVELKETAGRPLEDYVKELKNRWNRELL